MFGSSGNRLQEFVVLNGHQVFETDAVCVAGDEVAVVRVAVAAAHRRVAAGLVLEQEQPHLVHGLQVPVRSALGAVHVEGVLALGADDRTAGFERADRSVLELTECTEVVLVGHLAGWVTGFAAVVVRATFFGKRALGDKRLLHAHDTGDWTYQHVSQVHGMAEDVRADAVARLVHLEAPAEQSHGVCAVHREKAAAIVGDLPELALFDQSLEVLHQRSEAIVVAHTGDHASVPARLLNADGLLRFAANRLFTEDVFTGIGRGNTDLFVQHVRRGAGDHVDVVALHDLAPVRNSLFKTKTMDGHVTTVFQVVGTDREHRVICPVLKDLGNPCIASAVGLAHPTEADHGHAKWLTVGHIFSRERLIMRGLVPRAGPQCLRWWACRRRTSFAQRRLRPRRCPT